MPRSKHSAFGRVIPPGYMIYSLRLEGETPLLMSSPEIDRQGDTYKAFRTLSRARSKTPSDEERLRELEFYVRIYHDEKLGCYIPGRNIKELLRDAATKIKKGEDIRRSLIVPQYRIPLLYDGPRVPKKLWAEGFFYTTMVANSGSGSGRVERTRPMFTEWALECEIAFDPEDLSDEEVRFAVDRSTKYGLGDGRNQDFGRFQPTLTFQRKQHEAVDANGTKDRDRVAEVVAAQRSKAMLKD
jgi:hypothetical protein